VIRHFCIILGLTHILILLALSPVSSHAAVEREKLWVFFSDKGMSGEAELQSALAGLEESYNKRAIRRRAMRRTAPGLFDERDLKLHEPYVTAALGTGAELEVRSRWQNAISVHATTEQQIALSALACVNELRPVLRGKRVPMVPPIQLSAGGLSDFYGVTREQVTQINASGMHAQGYTGAGVVIGVLDTGFNRGHAAFNEPGHPLQVLAEWDFVNDDADTGIEPGDPAGQHDHGTYILALMAGYKPGEYVGSAYDASYVLAKAEDAGSEYPLEEDWFAAGLEFLEAKGADVATSSLLAYWYSQEEMDGETAIMTLAFNVATANGMHCCQAAGNAGHDSDPGTSHLIVPADAFEVLTVGAVDVSGQIAGFSSDGPTEDGRIKPEVLARGADAWTIAASNNTQYVQVSGTSAATPLIAGAVACIVQERPNWSVATMRHHLSETAAYFLEYGTHDPLLVEGFGIIDAVLASDLNTAAPEGDRQDGWGTSFAHPNPFRGETTISFSLTGPAEIRIELFDPQGRRVKVVEGGARSAGQGNLRLSGSGLPSGLYLYRLLSESREIAAGKLIYLNESASP
jgi:serine protease AprX